MTKGINRLRWMFHLGVFIIICSVTCSAVANDDLGEQPEYNATYKVRYVKANGRNVARGCVSTFLETLKIQLNTYRQDIQRGAGPSDDNRDACNNTQIILDDFSVSKEANKYIEITGNVIYKLKEVKAEGVGDEMLLRDCDALFLRGLGKNNAAGASLNPPGRCGRLNINGEFNLEETGWQCPSRYMYNSNYHICEPELPPIFLSDDLPATSCEDAGCGVDVNLTVVPTDLLEKLNRRLGVKWCREMRNASGCYSSSGCEKGNTDEVISVAIQQLQLQYCVENCSYVGVVDCVGDWILPDTPTAITDISPSCSIKNDIFDCINQHTNSCQGIGHLQSYGQRIKKAVNDSCIDETDSPTTEDPIQLTTAPTLFTSTEEPSSLTSTSHDVIIASTTILTGTKDNVRTTESTLAPNPPSTTTELPYCNLEQCTTDDSEASVCRRWEIKLNCMNGILSTSLCKLEASVNSSLKFIRNYLSKYCGPPTKPCIDRIRECAMPVIYFLPTLNATYTQMESENVTKFCSAIPDVNNCLGDLEDCTETNIIDGVDVQALYSHICIEGCSYAEVKRCLRRFPDAFQPPIQASKYINTCNNKVFLTGCLEGATNTCNVESPLLQHKQMLDEQFTFYCQPYREIPEVVVTWEDASSESIITTPLFTGQYYGNPTIRDGPRGKYIELDGNEQYVKFTTTGTCLSDPSLCLDGLSFFLWLNITRFEENMYMVSSRDDDNDSPGINIYYKSDIVHFELCDSEHIWRIQINSSEFDINEWFRIEMTWNVQNGLKVILNNELVLSESTGKTISPSTRKKKRSVDVNAEIHSTMKQLHGSSEESIDKTQIPLLPKIPVIKDYYDKKDNIHAQNVYQLQYANLITFNDMRTIQKNQKTHDTYLREKREVEAEVDPESESVAETYLYLGRSARNDEDDIIYAEMAFDDFAFVPAHRSTLEDMGIMQRNNDPCSMAEVDVCVKKMNHLVNYSGSQDDDKHICQYFSCPNGTTPEVESCGCFESATSGCGPGLIQAAYEKLVENSLTQYIDEFNCDYYGPGLQFLTSSAILIEEGAPATVIQFNLTGPPLKVCGSRTCQVEVLLDNEDTFFPICRKTNASIPQLVVEGDTCLVQVSTDNYKETHEILVRAKLDWKYDGMQTRKIGLRFKDGSTLPIATVDVNIEDKDGQATCQSINDPHLLTFDGLSYNNFFSGEFILYKRTDFGDNPFRVHVMYQNCGENVLASCNCGVAVQSNDDIFVIERCRRRKDPFQTGRFNNNKPLLRADLILNGQLTPGTKIISDAEGRVYHVHLPHGTFVTIKLNEDLLNVWVTASPSDEGHTQGLCGSYDRNVLNDLMFSNGTIDGIPPTVDNNTIEPNEFSASWRVDMSSETIFNGVPANDEYTPKMYCSCTGTLEDCEYSNHVSTCDIFKGEDVTEALVTEAVILEANSGVRRRKRREAGFNVINFDINEKQLPPIYKWPTLSNRTEAWADQYCISYAFEKSEIGKQCRKLPNIDFKQEVTSCIEDIKITDDIEWAQSSLDAIKAKCLSEVERNTEISEELANSIDAAMCPVNCANNGTCVNGVCICGPDFMGGDCTVSKTKPPTILGMANNGECDGNCKRATIYGETFVKSNNLTCHFEIVELTNSSTEYSGNSTKVKAIFNNFNQIECTLPKSGQSYMINVSNDAEHMSDPVLFITFNSTCQTCDAISGTCSINPNFCYIHIENKCYDSGYASPSDPCMTCNPTEDNRGFTPEPGCSPDADVVIVPTSTPVGFLGTRDIIIIAACAAVALVIVIVMVTAIIIWRKKKHDSNDGPSDQGIDTEAMHYTNIALHRDSGLNIMYDDAAEFGQWPGQFRIPRPSVYGRSSRGSSSGTTLDGVEIRDDTYF